METKYIDNIQYVLSYSSDISSIYMRLDYYLLKLITKVDITKTVIIVNNHTPNSGIVVYSKYNDDICYSNVIYDCYYIYASYKKWKLSMDTNL
jgi:hypothetical protein